MRVLILAKGSDEVAETVKTGFPGDRVELFRTAGDIAHRLCGSPDKETVAVLLPANEEELIDIYSMRNSFRRVPFLLVLPSRDKIVEAMGYGLKSSIVCYRESNIAEALSALKRCGSTSDPAPAA